MLKVFVANLGKYNEGCLCGEWVELPINASDWADVMECIGIDGVQYEEWFVADYDCDVDGLTAHLGEYEDIEMLNWLAARLEELNEWDISNLQALLECGEHCGSAAEIVDLCEEAENGGNSIILSGVDDDDDLGRYYVEELGAAPVNSVGWLMQYIDYEAVGRDVRLDEGGTHTDHGYVCMISSDFANSDHDDIPDEYRLYSHRD